MDKITFYKILFGEIIIFLFKTSLFISTQLDESIHVGSWNSSFEIMSSKKGYFSKYFQIVLFCQIMSSDNAKNKAVLHAIGWINI